jgi:glycerol-3-phosphate dehydrogenase
MWQRNWREKIWSEIDQDWDMIIVGGGITGAGILREATRIGLHALLVEQRDFAWGTSSRSSKLVHGGLRYLKEGKIKLTRESVHEREHLLREGPGLVEPLNFLLATYDGDSPGRLIYGAGLTVYDLLAMRWSHRYYSAQDFRLMAGALSAEGLEGGYRYGDAQTDDARLVLRVIREAVAGGGTAINYVKAEELLRDDEGMVVGVQLKDVETNRLIAVRTSLVINATGAWADRLREEIGAEAKIRPLRGSHLIFPSWRLPLSQAVSFLHPFDGRPVFLFPWEGVTLVGTTDVDYDRSLDDEPGITGEEVAYLMAAVEARYPLHSIKLDDVIATFAGVRPVIGSGKENPSAESRDHVIWAENKLLTATGGKLTTFRLVAMEVLNKASRIIDIPEMDKDMPVLDPLDMEISIPHDLAQSVKRRLCGRYGTDAQALLDTAQAGELEVVAGTPVLWAELRWAARSEGVVHLEDLLLRRVRLGLLTEAGAKAHLPRIRAICQEELGWHDDRWEAEERAYFELWNCCYSLPPKSTIPDWRWQLADSQREHIEAKREARSSNGRSQKLGVTAILAALLFVVAIYLAGKKTSPDT